jgi:hypothetical protein
MQQSLGYKRTQALLLQEFIQVATQDACHDLAWLRLHKYFPKN